ncbi:MAG: Hint domain-containing protein [Albidovulum sp.]
MPTSYIDQFFIMDPGNAPPGGTALSVVKRTMVDQNDNNLIDTVSGDTVNGVNVTRVWVGDTITVTMNGSTVTITGVTFYLATGPAIFTPTDGTILSDAVFISSTFVSTSTQTPVGNFGPPCFVAGTLISVPGNTVPVETLQPGDLVTTLDQGPQPIRWVGQRTVDASADFAPVCFAPGVIGNARALMVSPQHRMLVSGWMAELYFGLTEVLVAAKHLVGAPGVSLAPMAHVIYVHLLFDQHEIIFAEGAASESFHPGSEMLEQDQALRAEIAAIFPDITDAASRDQIPSARMVIRGREARLLVPQSPRAPARSSAGGKRAVLPGKTGPNTAWSSHGRAERSCARR